MLHPRSSFLYLVQNGYTHFQIEGRNAVVKIYSSLVLLYPYIKNYKHTETQTHTDTHRHTHKHTQTHTNRHKHTQIYTQTHINTNTQIQKRIHKHKDK